MLLRVELEEIDGEFELSVFDCKTFDLKFISRIKSKDQILNLNKDYIFSLENPDKLIIYNKTEFIEISA